MDLIDGNVMNTCILGFLEELNLIYTHQDTSYYQVKYFSGITCDHDVYII